MQRFGRKVIDAQSGLPFSQGLLMALQLVECGGKQQVWLKNLRHEINRLPEGLEGFLRMTRGVKSEADEVVEFGGTRL